MNKGSPEWLDAKILAMLDRAWARKGKYLSPYELAGYFTEQGRDIALCDIQTRLYYLCAAHILEAQLAPNGGGQNVPTLLRYSRLRARWWAELP